MQQKISRRRFNASIAISAAANAFPCSTRGVQVEPTALRAPTEFSLNYILASSMYGYEKIETILPQVGKIGATAIDICNDPFVKRGIGILPDMTAMKNQSNRFPHGLE